MNRLKAGIQWFDSLLPEGLVVPSSTVISGPGGTGKPLVEFAFVAAWLKAGGSLIGIPLQYPSGELVRSAMKQLYDIDLQEYSRKTAMIHFEPAQESCRQINDNTLMANMVRPDQWDEAIEKAGSLIEVTPPGVMIFGSALNLLLFSKRYRRAILEKMKDNIRNDKSRNYLFAVSTTAFADEIAELEKEADNLMFTRMDKPMRLFLKIERMKDVPFTYGETEVPIPEAMLLEISKIAEATRRRRVKEIGDL